MGEVFVPISDIGIGWHARNRWAEVTDARSGARFRVPDRRAALVGGVLCVPGRSLGVEDGLHRVKIAGLPALWARVVLRDDNTQAA